MRSLPASLYLVLLSMATFIQCQVKGSNKDKGEVFIPGFFNSVYSDQILDFDLTFEWDSLAAHLDAEEKIPAVLTINNILSDSIEISGRGVTRKKICDFPPLHVNFSSRLRQKYHWGKYKKYKLVTHCNDQQDPGELVLKEFLVYQLYNMLTPHSLRVQLCRVNYDAGHGQSKHYAFIIEDEDEMAERLGGEIIKEKDGPIKQVNKKEYQKLVLFQYMIGNTDWNLTRRHNVRFISLPHDPFAVPVPYDFDYSGLVNAPYASPHSSLPINHVTQRLWQYRGTSEDDFSEVKQLFLVKKDSFIAAINTQVGLGDVLKKEMTDYILSFYREMESDSWPTNSI